MQIKITEAMRQKLEDAFAKELLYACSNKLKYKYYGREVYKGKKDLNGNKN